MARKYQFLAAWLLLNAGIGQCLSVFSLTAGEFRTEAEAKEHVDRLSASMAPVFVHHEPEGNELAWKVKAGHFPFQAEAYAYSVALKPSMGALLPVSEWTWDGTSLQENRLPAQLPFSKAEPNIVGQAKVRMEYETPASSPLEELARSARGDDAELFRRFKDAKTRAERIETGEALLHAHPNSALAAETRLNLAWSYLNGKQYGEARSHLEAVASKGNATQRSRARLSLAHVVLRMENPERAREAFLQVANADDTQPDQRLEAMIRAAFLSEKLKASSPAWLSWLQIERATSDPKVVALARMHKAALAFDMVLAVPSRSTWSEVRQLCLQAEAVAGAPTNDKATARLMYAESYYMERNYERAQQEAAALVETYPQHRRERVAGHYWQARAFYQLGRYSEALKEFDLVAKEPLQPGEKFFNLDVQGRVVIERAKALEQQGDRREMERLLGTLALDAPATNP